MFRVILAMSEQRREVERSLSNVTMKLMEHLFKVFMMPDYESTNHWKTEIFSFIHTVPKLKNTKKLPTSKQIYTWTYDKYQDVVGLDLIDAFLNYMEYHYGYDSSSLDLQVVIEKFDKLCVEYFTWLSDTLSSKGTIQFVDTYNKIDALVLKYRLE